MTPSPDLQAARIDALSLVVKQLATLVNRDAMAPALAALYEAERAYTDAMAGDVATDPIGGGV